MDIDEENKPEQNELTASEEVEVYEVYEQLEDDASPFIDSEQDLYLLDDDQF